MTEIEPHEKPNLIDLVKAAGVDVSDWANCDTYASRNPKYCYEWAFVEDKKVVVLNLWLYQMKERHGIVFTNVNPKEYAAELQGIRRERGLNADRVINTAHKNKLPVRVIIQKEKTPGDYEIVSKRMLDPVIWAVASYDENTGECKLIRGASPKGNLAGESETAIDDLSDVPEGNLSPDRAKVISHVIKRDNQVRGYVLKRAKGRCEYCNEKGFLTSGGGYYLEAHHIISLGDSGSDTVENVIAVCPEHHRQAHYGADADSLEAKFIKIIGKRTWTAD